MENEYRHCMLCPRMCGADRFSSVGSCGMGAEIKAAKACLHQWEEPCISYKNGAGTVFFSGCNLHCCFCQNNDISNNFSGQEISVERLADIFLELQEKGADNIDLVTATHYIPSVIKALDMVKAKLDIPVVFNCGGYERPETIKMLEGYVDIYLPDLKYFSPEISEKYSGAADYFEFASASIKEMIRQVGKLKYNENGGLEKGTVIRHLVLPSCRHDSMKIMEWTAENTSPENVLVSIMNQYTPFEHIPEKFPELRRKVTKMEYNSVVKYACSLGIQGFTQENSSASEKYVPDFDFSGIRE